MNEVKNFNYEGCIIVYAEVNRLVSSYAKDDITVRVDGAQTVQIPNKMYNVFKQRTDCERMIYIDNIYTLREQRGRGNATHALARFLPTNAGAVTFCSIEPKLGNGEVREEYQQITVATSRLFDAAGFARINFALNVKQAYPALFIGTLTGKYLYEVLRKDYTEETGRIWAHPLYNPAAEIQQSDAMYHWLWVE
jgi:hypothetical protein